MAVEIRVPEVGESVREALLAEWFVGDGEAVKKDQSLFLLETDKITLEVPAEAAGTVKILVEEGQTVAVGDVVGRIEEGGAPSERMEETEQQPAAGEEPEEEEAEARKEAAEKAEADEAPKRPRKEERKEAAGEEKEKKAPGKPETETREDLQPAVRQLVEEHGLDPSAIPASGPGDRLTRGDVLLYLEGRQGAKPKERPARPEPRAQPKAQPREEPGEGSEGVTRKPMTPIRRRIAERLLQAKHATAMLTTFNEIDMGRVKALRSLHQEAFRARHGVKLGFMSFFVKAAVDALKAFPVVNAFLDGDDVVYHDYYHVGVAVGAERGLVVPVIRHADRLGFAEIEAAIGDYVEKIRSNRLELADLEGGTFTITNGGVFGSLLSTPILNYPQSAILGLHKLEDRPVVVDGQVVVRPMMYVALSYDHRLVDGREAVQFLARIKGAVEEPERLLLEV